MVNKTRLVQPAAATPGQELLNALGRIVNPPPGGLTERDRQTLGGVMALARQVVAATQPPPEEAVLDEEGFVILDEEGRPILMG